jgi:aminoglycoside phosphotransferase (APT) family kinase protein
VDAATIAERIGCTLVGKLAHGENAGAFEVRTAEGDPAVLKVGGDSSIARPIVEALRARGYPAPATLAHGTVDAEPYEVLELMRGEALAAIAAAHLPQVLECNQLQRDLAMPGRIPWRDDMLGSLFEGHSGYCELEPLRARDPELLERLQRIAEIAADVDLRSDDAVHYDFSPYNLIGSGDEITGVVDWQGATTGDAAFDLVTLAYYTYDPECHARLVAAALDATDPRAAHLYAAHMVLRQCDWSLRFHDDFSFQWHRDLGVALLADVGAG